jgi:twitching motility two-component system response regulator PilH
VTDLTEDRIKAMCASATIETRPASVSHSEDEAAGRGRAIALIDDNAKWVETVSEVLTEAGFEVQAASNQDEALDLLDRARPVLVLLDVHLLRANGLEILREFRRQNRTTPVLVVSADERASVREHAMCHGASGFLQKPLSTAVLLQAVRRLALRAAA